MSPKRIHDFGPGWANEPEPTPALPGFVPMSVEELPPQIRAAYEAQRDLYQIAYELAAAREMFGFDREWA